MSGCLGKWRRCWISDTGWRIQGIPQCLNGALESRKMLFRCVKFSSGFSGTVKQNKQNIFLMVEVMRCAWAENRLCVCVLSRVWFFAIPWTGAHQTPLSRGLSRQEYWSVLPFLPLGDLPDPGIKVLSPESPALQADSLLLSNQGEIFRF